MDPVLAAASLAAVIFALLAMLQWRRAGDLEDRVRELEAKLADATPRPADDPEPEAEPPVARAEEPEEDESDQDEPEDEEDESEEDEPEEDESEEEPEEDEPEEDEPEEDEPEEEEADAPAPAPAAAKPAAKPAGPDPQRMAALKVVTDAFETCRYLEFDAIVEKPATYRVTVPLTAANGATLRYLEKDMFACLVFIEIEGSQAVLHIDMQKGRP